MKIGYLGMQDFFAAELLRELKSGSAGDEFLTWLPGDKAPAMDLEVLIATGNVTADELAGQTKLGLVQTASAGYEGVDLDAASAAGIWVGAAPTTETRNGESVAEFAVLLLLAASRRLNEELAWTRDPENARPEKPEVNKALFGKTVCIVGLGGIGDLLVERLRGFGVVLTGVDVHPERAPEGVKAYGIHELQQAAATADYVVLAIPGSKENENLIDAGVLQSMKKGAVLVNIARGILVEEAALISAVQSGQLYGAGLDVVKGDPVKADNPLLAESRILVTPHIAGSTDIMLAGTVKYLGEALAQYRNGERPDGIVNEPKQPRVSLRAKNSTTGS